MHIVKKSEICYILGNWKSQNSRRFCFSRRKSRLRRGGRDRWVQVWKEREKGTPRLAVVSPAVRVRTLTGVGAGIRRGWSTSGFRGMSTVAADRWRRWARERHRTWVAEADGLASGCVAIWRRMTIDAGRCQEEDKMNKKFRISVRRFRRTQFFFAWSYRWHWCFACKIVSISYKQYDYMYLANIVEKTHARTLQSCGYIIHYV
jgi:hypothetical protein